MSLRTVATRRSAVVSGLLIGFAMPALEAWQAATKQSPDAINVQFLVALVLFLFAPVALFVVGTDYLAFGYRDTTSKSYWVAFRAMAVRMLFWLCGGGVAFAVLAIISSLRS